MTANRADPSSFELSYSHNPGLPIKFRPETFASEVAQHLADGQTVPFGACAFVRIHDLAKPILFVEILGRLFSIPGFALWPKPGTILTAVPFNSGITEIPPRVAATAFFETSFAWAQQEDGQLHVMQATASGNQRVATVTSAREEPDVQFGFSIPPTETWGIVSVAADAETRAVAAPKLAPTTIEAGVPIVGVCLRHGRPALLTRPDPYRLAWLTNDPREEVRRELLATAHAPIVAVAVSPARPTIAWLTEAGEVVVYSMRHNAVLFRRLPGDGP